MRVYTVTAVDRLVPSPASVWQNRRLKYPRSGPTHMDSFDVWTRFIVRVKAARIDAQALLRNRWGGSPH
jgi:hypothetical protein